MQKKFTTKVLHTPFIKKDTHGSLNMPVYDSAAFEFDSAYDMELAFEGKKPKHAYSRITNPTVENLEQRIKNASGAFTVTALASGMAAISNVAITLFQSGDNIITSKKLFGNTYSLFESTLKPFGISIKYTDLTNISAIEQNIDENTQAIFVETITNPQLEVPDMKAIADLANKKGVILIADTTLAPLTFFDSKFHGVNIEVISSTKYISGGATSIGGLILDYGNFDWSKYKKFEDIGKKHGPFAFFLKLKREVYRNLGACLSPHNAYLQSLGLETFALRAERTSENCFALAKSLQNLRGVKAVNYPGLETSTYFDIAKKQFNGRPGAILTFDLETKEACHKFLDKLKIIKRATNLNDNKSLIIHPASTIFSDFDNKTKTEMDIRDTMLRLSVGIEDINDLIQDIEQALK